MIKRPEEWEERGSILVDEEVAIIVAKSYALPWKKIFALHVGEGTRPLVCRHDLSIDWLRSMANKGSTLLVICMKNK